MAIAELGIPDDTPENTVRAIKQILEQEAKRRSTAFTSDEKLVDDIRNSVTVKVGVDPNAFTISLNWVKSRDLGVAKGSVGSGTIFPDWTLELLHGPPANDRLGWNPSGAPQPPFRWGIYRRDRDNYLHRPPEGILDGARLRALLSDLLPSPQVP